MNISKNAASLLIVGILILGTSAPARAVPIQWNLSDVQFLDFGTASGSFVYDADTNTVSAVNITTTVGSSGLGGASFGFSRPFPWTGANFLTFLGADPNLPDLTGVPYLVFGVVNPLTNAGGTRLLNTTNSLESECYDSSCGLILVWTPRKLRSGSLVSSAIAVPEPATLALLISGLALLAFRRRDKGDVSHRC